MLLAEHGPAETTVVKNSDASPCRLGLGTIADRRGPPAWPPGDPSCSDRPVVRSPDSVLGWHHRLMMEPFGGPRGGSVWGGSVSSTRPAVSLSVACVHASISRQMPELPDIVVYIDCLEKRILGERLDRVQIASPFLLRTASPPIGETEGKCVRTLHRIGKRIAIGVEDDLYLVLHLMIAGRLHWTAPGAKMPAKRGLATFQFPNGAMLLTEAGSKRRASLHIVRGTSDLNAMDPGGLDPFETDVATFGAALARANHTLKRALTDPQLISGIGNAYSDEILHRAQLSPVRMTRTLEFDDVDRLFNATRTTLAEWTERLRAEAGDGFPKKVTAFRAEMAGAWPLSPTLSALRCTGAADRICRQRDELLCAVPDTGKTARGSGAVTPSTQGLAAHSRRTRTTTRPRTTILTRR